MRAAGTGDEKRVRELVAAGAKLDIVSGGWSALHYASDSGHVRIAKLLLDGKYEGTGADINLQTTSGGEAPLIWACVFGREAVVRLLLERGADVTLRDNGSRTALYWARAKNRAAVMALLKAHGAPE